MALEEIKTGHFDGGQNLTRGHRDGTHGSDTTLEEFLGKFKAGREVASGAGDVVVAFTTPFATDNVTVTVSGDGVSAPTLKTGVVPDKNGFTVTAAGAGPVHWNAVED